MKLSPSILLLHSTLSQDGYDELLTADMYTFTQCLMTWLFQFSILLFFFSFSFSVDGIIRLDQGYTKDGVWMF